MEPTATKTKANGNFRTSDMYYAAYLKTAGVAFLDTERDGQRVYFLFQDQPGMRDLRTQFYSRTAKVPALTYADEIKALKVLTHGE